MGEFFAQNLPSVTRKPHTVLGYGLTIVTHHIFCNFSLLSEYPNEKIPIWVIFEIFFSEHHGVTLAQSCVSYGIFNKSVNGCVGVFSGVLMFSRCYGVFSGC